MTLRRDRCRYLPPSLTLKLTRGRRDIRLVSIFVILSFFLASVVAGELNALRDIAASPRGVPASHIDPKRTETLSKTGLNPGPSGTNKSTRYSGADGSNTFCSHDSATCATTECAKVSGLIDGEKFDINEEHLGAIYDYDTLIVEETADGDVWTRQATTVENEDDEEQEDDSEAEDEDVVDEEEDDFVEEVTKVEPTPIKKEVPRRSPSKTTSNTVAKVSAQIPSQQLPDILVTHQDGRVEQLQILHFRHTHAHFHHDSENGGGTLHTHEHSHFDHDTHTHRAAEAIVNQVPVDVLAANLHVNGLTQAVLQIPGQTPEQPSPIPEPVPAPNPQPATTTAKSSPSSWHARRQKDRSKQPIRPYASPPTPTVVEPIPTAATPSPSPTPSPSHVHFHTLVQPRNMDKYNKKPTKPHEFTEDTAEYILIPSFSSTFHGQPGVQIKTRKPAKGKKA